jgi:excisionase family DNA binding protein
MQSRLREIDSMPSMTAPDDEKLTPEQAAKYLGVKVQTLAAWRSSGKYDLPYIPVGRSIRYLKSDLAAWLARRRTTAVARSED